MTLTGFGGEGGRERGREGRRERGREGKREGGKEGGREGCPSPGRMWLVYTFKVCHARNLVTHSSDSLTEDVKQLGDILMGVR